MCGLIAYALMLLCTMFETCREIDIILISIPSGMTSRVWVNAIAKYATTKTALYQDISYSD